MEPILRYLAKHPDGALARDVHEASADALGLSRGDRKETIKSGQLVYKNRAGWAHDRLKRRGYSSSLRRGYWQLTPAGFEFAQKHPAPWSDELVSALASDSSSEGVGPAEFAAKHPEGIKASPDDRLSQALREIRESVATNIMEALSQVSPTHFEQIVLDLLHKMGYGTSRSDVKRLGGTGDGGIDGVISLDRLGLEKVYLQAKRWQESVGRPVVQGFYGALKGQRARKGVMITTSSYTPQAREFANSVEGIVLVDGQWLAELMMDHGIGVVLEKFSIPAIDSDYFEI